MRSLRILSLVVSAVCFLPNTGRAQVAQAELRGTVVDESGGALPGATITATHIDTGTVRTTVTSGAGTFVMPALPTGAYKINGLPPGTYYVAAVADEFASDWQDPTFLETLSRNASQVTLDDGQKKTQDLRTMQLR